MEAEKSSQAIDLNFVPLANKDQSVRYFKLLHNFFEIMLNLYAKRTRQGGDHEKINTLEAEIAKSYLEKLLFTVETLRIKYYSNSSDKPRIDTTDSGFPSHQDIFTLRSNLAMKEENLAKLPRASTLKSQALDHMFKNKSDPANIVELLSQRKFMEMISAEKMFLTLTTGQLLPIESEDENTRRYLFSWGCYDQSSNRPYIHIMLIERNASYEPLEEQGTDYQKLLQKIQYEDSHITPLAVLAASIDQELDEVHPKFLKRICLGPIYSEEFSVQNPEEINSIFQLVDKDHRNIYCLEEEIVYSAKQVESKNLFFKKRLCEIYYVSELDVEAFQRKASLVRKYMLIPHNLRQHSGALFPEYTKITFSKKGEINGH